MNKWAFALAAAAVVVIGCGGSSGGHPINGTTGTPGQSIATVNLASVPGLVDFTFLTGAGRAAGDPTAIIRRVVLTDSFGAEESKLFPQKFLQLNAYTQQIASLNVPTTVSRLFNEYDLEIKELDVANDPPSPPTQYPQQPATTNYFSQNFPATIRAFPARHTAVAIRLDETMIDFTQNPPAFLPDLFAIGNENASTNTITGFISDYVMFDLSALSPADQPPLTLGGNATRVYFSGDTIALSGDGPTGPMEVLTPLGITEGIFGPPTSIAPFGTYSLLQVDPRDLAGLARITALQGIWRNVPDVINNLGNFEVISFPSTNDDNLQDCVLILRSGSQITKMYFGQIDLDAGTLQAFPIGQVTSGDASNDIAGTVSAYKDGNGSTTVDPRMVHSGQYTLTNGTLGTVPAGFLTSGRFIVFRK